MVSYDFFLAHAGPDTVWAERLYNLLRAEARVFLDSKSLLLGDDWNRALPEAQRSSRVTVVLVSANTDAAFYQREEIAAAIDMARADATRHRVVPVYLGTSRESIPYGLRLMHGLDVSEHFPLEQVAARLLDLNRQMVAGIAGEAISDDVVPTPEGGQSQVLPVRTALRRLRDLLAELIFREDEAKRIVRDSGVPIGGAWWSSDPRSFWQGALDDAHRASRMGKLFSAIDEVLEANPEWEKAKLEYLRARDADNHVRLRPVENRTIATVERMGKEKKASSRVDESTRTGMTESASNVPGRIFMSYRREDTDYPAAWLYGELARHFGRDQVFKDVDSIELGDDFVEVITSAVASCDVLLALIGRRWLTITGQDGQRRLDNPGDFVRLEIEAALARNIRIIPILVEAAHMPRANELPESLAKLARRQALELSSSRFDLDTHRLLGALDRTIFGIQKRARQEVEHLAGQRAEQLVEVDSLPPSISGTEPHEHIASSEVYTSFGDVQATMDEINQAIAWLMDTEGGHGSFTAAMESRRNPLADWARKGYPGLKTWNSPRVPHKPQIAAHLRQKLASIQDANDSESHS